MLTVEQSLDEIIEQSPRVVGTGWTRQPNETDGTKVYVVRIKPEPVEFALICGNRKDPWQCNLKPDHQSDHGQVSSENSGGIYWPRIRTIHERFYMGEGGPPKKEDYPANIKRAALRAQYEKEGWKYSDGKSPLIPDPQDCRPENPCRLCLSKEHS